ncbi:hypothetical protein SEVIR_6G060101v4 [Setaria viridis]
MPRRKEVARAMLANQQTVGPSRLRFDPQLEKIGFPKRRNSILSLPWRSATICRIDKFPQDLLQKLPALEYLCIDGCPDLPRRCRQGGEYFDLVSTIQNKEIPFPATSSNMKKVLKKLLRPSC